MLYCVSNERINVQVYGWWRLQICLKLEPPDTNSDQVPQYVPLFVLSLKRVSSNEMVKLNKFHRNEKVARSLQ